MKKFLIVLLLPIVLAGCAAPVSRIAVNGPEPVNSAPFQDLRPKSEKESEIFSYLITSAGYAIYRKGDETLSPNAAQLLRRRANERLGVVSGTGPSVTVHHLVVYWNRKSELRKGAMGNLLGGVIGGALVWAAEAKNTVNISQTVADSRKFLGVEDEYERAYFAPEENPGKASVFVTYIDAEIDGKRIFTRTLAPSAAEKGKDPYVVAVEASIDYFLSHFGSSPAVASAN